MAGCRVAAAKMAEALFRKPASQGMAAVRLGRHGGTGWRAHHPWHDDANQEAVAGGARIVSDEAESLRSQEKNWLAIKGLEAASSQGALRNPFAPDHAYREAAEKSQPDKLANKRLSADIGQAAASVNVQAGVAPAAAKVQSGLAPIPAGRQVNTEDQQIYLQGIIEMDGSPGALLTLKGQNKFLLAGESWQGYTVESIGEDAILLGGRHIAIGESMAL